MTMESGALVDAAAQAFLGVEHSLGGRRWQVAPSDERLALALSQPIRLTLLFPKTVTPSLLSLLPSTVAPSLEEAKLARQSIWMSTEEKTATLPFRQYQPCGFKSLIVLRENTLTLGLTNTSSGCSVPNLSQPSATNLISGYLARMAL